MSVILEILGLIRIIGAAAIIFYFLPRIGKDISEVFGSDDYQRYLGKEELKKDLLILLAIIIFFIILVYILQYFISCQLGPIFKKMGI